MPRAIRPIWVKSRAEESGGDTQRPEENSQGELPREIIAGLFGVQEDVVQESSWTEQQKEALQRLSDLLKNIEFITLIIERVEGEIVGKKDGWVQEDPEAVNANQRYSNLLKEAITSVFGPEAPNASAEAINVGWCIGSIKRDKSGIPHLNLVPTSSEWRGYEISISVVAKEPPSATRVCRRRDSTHLAAFGGSLLVRVVVQQAEIGGRYSHLFGFTFSLRYDKIPTPSSSRDNLGKAVKEVLIAERIFTYYGKARGGQTLRPVQ
jgi:hypothetical protein